MPFLILGHFYQHGLIQVHIYFMFISSLAIEWKSMFFGTHWFDTFPSKTIPLNEFDHFCNKFIKGYQSWWHERQCAQWWRSRWRSPRSDAVECSGPKVRPSPPKWHVATSNTASTSAPVRQNLLSLQEIWNIRWSSELNSP